MELSRDFTLVDHYLYPSQRGIDIDEKTTRPSRKKLARDLRRSQKGDLRFPRSGRRNHRERWEGQLGLLPPFFSTQPPNPNVYITERVLYIMEKTFRENLKKLLENFDEVEKGESRVDVICEILMDLKICECEWIDGKWILKE